MVFLPMHCCSDYNTIANQLHQVFQKGVDQDMVILMAARASRTENQDAIDATIVGMLADPKEVIGFLLSLCCAANLLFF